MTYLTPIRAQNNEVAQCNTTLLKIFGVQNIMEEPRKANPLEKAYCRRNKNTCCNTQNFNTVNNSFAKGISELFAKFEVVEEVLALFKGGKFTEFVKTFESNEECKSHVQDMSIEIDGQIYDFFSTTYQNVEIEKIANLLIDVEIYLKKIIWFHSNTFCSVCNHDLQSYFKLNAKDSILNAHSANCFEILEEKETEYNLMKSYIFFISKVVEFFKCNAGEDLEEEGNSEEAMMNPLKLEPVNMEMFNKFGETYQTCVLDEKVENPECVQFCTKSFRTYEFPDPLFFRNMQVSLKVLFKIITEEEIEEYYENIKGEEFHFNQLDGSIEFFSSNDENAETAFDKIAWVYSNSSGINIYRQIMSKKFIHFEYKSIGIMSSLVLSLMSLFYVLK